MEGELILRLESVIPNIWYLPWDYVLKVDVEDNLKLSCTAFTSQIQFEFR
jgi:hypothetical protein